MKEYIKILIFTATLLILATACKKDFLDVSPTTSVSDDALWQSPDLINAFVISQYGGHLGWGWAFGRGLGWWGLNLGIVSDEAVDQWDFDTNSLINNTGLITPGNAGIFEGYYGYDPEKVWPNSYNYIRNANSILEHLKDIKAIDENTKTGYIAEIKFLRAFRYFNLLKFYGGAVLLDKTFQLGDNYLEVKRSSIDSTVNFILKDLDDAEKDLPQFGDATLGRASKQAAMALRSRLLLYAASPLYNTANDLNKWKLAADASLKLIQDGTFSFATDYAAQFLSAVGNPEAIFASLNTTPPLDWGSGFYNEQADCPTGSGIFAAGFGCFSPSQNLVDAFEMANGKYITDPTSGYDPQDPYKNRDPRLDLTILHNGMPFHGETAEFFEGGNLSFDASSQASPTRYAVLKLLDPKLPVSGADAVAGKQPYIHFRLSEIYLNYAEAINEFEGPTKAYDYINAVRTRAAVGMPALPAGLDQGQMRERIQHERQIELVFEDHRYFDVRRWKIAEVTDNLPLRGVKITKDPDTGVLSYDYSLECKQKTFLPKMYFLPIPLKDIQSNSLLEQNPGY